jgi:hypothetical protein
VSLNSGGVPVANSGDLYSFYSDMPSDRNLWPFGLGAQDYGGRIIYTDKLDPNYPGYMYWGFNFNDGQYDDVSVQWSYGWVGVMAVREYQDNGNGNGNPVPEPATLLLLGAGLIGLANYGRKKLN